MPDPSPGMGEGSSLAAREQIIPHPKPLSPKNRERGFNPPALSLPPLTVDGSGRLPLPYLDALPNGGGRRGTFSLAWMYFRERVRVRAQVSLQENKLPLTPNPSPLKPGEGLQSTHKRTNHLSPPKHGEGFILPFFLLSRRFAPAPLQYS